MACKKLSESNNLQAFCDRHNISIANYCISSEKFPRFIRLSGIKRCDTSESNIEVTTAEIQEKKCGTILDNAVSSSSATTESASTYVTDKLHTAKIIPMTSSQNTKTSDIQTRFQTQLLEAQNIPDSAITSPCHVLPVWWLPANSFAFDGGFKLSKTKVFRDGLIHALDASSMATVFALDPQPGEHILDLCCAPGAKFCLIADLMQLHGTLTGIDIAEQRLRAMISIVRRMGVSVRSNAQQGWRCRLLCMNATSFREAPPQILDTPGFVIPNGNSVSIRPQTDSRKSKKRRTDKSETSNSNSSHTVMLDSAVDNRFRNKQLIISPNNTTKLTANTTSDGGATQTTANSSSGNGNTSTNSFFCYDRVLVDAQCTHDGSVKHLEKHLADELQEYVTTLASPEVVESTSKLQYKLLESGFQHVKLQGILVYATCSLTETQNEQVVAKFLTEYNGQVRLVHHGLDHLCTPNTDHITDDTEVLSHLSAGMRLHCYCPKQDDSTCNKNKYPWQSGRICPGLSETDALKLAQFTPARSMCGGLFIAKFQRIGFPTGTNSK